MTRQCANCDELIGNLETAHLWGDHTVCNRCLRILAARVGQIPFIPVATVQHAQAVSRPVSPLPPAESSAQLPDQLAADEVGVVPPEAEPAPANEEPDELQALAVAASTSSPPTADVDADLEEPSRPFPWMTVGLAVAVCALIGLVLWQRFPPGGGSREIDAPGVALDPAMTSPGSASVPDAAPTDSALPAAQATATADVPVADPVRSLVVAGRGQVQINATWKANNFGGNEGDAGSVVLLIPKGLKQKLPSSAINPENAEILLDDTRKVLARFDAYIAIVGGDGTTTISGVLPGEYNVVILSKNAHDNTEGQQRSQAQLEAFFDTDTATTVSKVFFSDVTVSAGNEVDVSHDFGSTAS